ncbi:MAG: hypothetical protein NXI29_26465 [bacterium]|nr:hypothetical protein [bacterium]
MVKFISDKLLSQHTVSVLITTTAFVTAVVTLLIDLEMKLSIKWFILLFIIATSLVIILCKIIFDLWSIKLSTKDSEEPISYYKDQKLLVIRKNKNIKTNMLVGCYFIHNDVEHFLFPGIVHHDQEKVTQIKIISQQVDENIALPENYIKNMRIRPVLVQDAINEIISQYHK